MDECSICLEAALDVALTLSCNHRFHRACILKCLEFNLKQCPLCRKSFSRVEIEKPFGCVEIERPFGHVEIERPSIHVYTLDVLPNYVLWLIFLHVIPCEVSEEGELNDFRSILSRTCGDLALISKTCLRILTTKCVRHGRGWRFVRGALIKF